MNLLARLAALERGRARVNVSDAELRARLTPLCRAHDVSLDEAVDEVRQLLQMTPAEYIRAIAESLAAAPPAYECTAHAGPPCRATLRAAANGRR